ncbi:hypothetical protein Mapa_007110 [Marchantia paleacea]|nr:hypothetical protein Mapa_007110 [Marchantia paleacea]
MSTIKHAVFTRGLILLTNSRARHDSINNTTVRSGNIAPPETAEYRNSRETNRARNHSKNHFSNLLSPPPVHQNSSPHLLLRSPRSSHDLPPDFPRNFKTKADQLLLCTRSKPRAKKYRPQLAAPLYTTLQL